MAWDLTYGPHAEALVRASAEAGRPPPPEAVPPTLPDHLRFAYSAYRKLSSDRDSMGSMRIRYSAIDAYATRYGITSIDEFERFLGLIEVLDNKYLELNAEMERANADRRTNQNTNG